MAKTTERVTMSADAEDAAVLAGISSAFDRLGALGPQVLSLQAALLGGVVRSQRKEADRLAKTYGKEDDRVRRAVARIELLDGFAGETTKHAAQVARFVETVQKDGTFHGYVLQSDGSPAAGYTVTAEASNVEQKTRLRGKGKTDADGYFSFNMAGVAQPADQKTATVDRVLDRLRQAAAAAEAKDTKDTGTAAAGKAGDATKDTIAAKAEVTDPTGRVVFEDPIPPTFDAMPSEFRIYALDPTATTKGATRTAKTAKKSK